MFRSIKSRNAKNLSSALNVAISRSPPQAVQDVVDSIGSNFGTSNNGESRLEQLTKQWINNHCLLEGNSIANRGDMYACYVDHIRNEHGILACSMQMFINQLKYGLIFFVILFYWALVCCFQSLIFTRFFNNRKFLKIKQ